MKKNIKELAAKAAEFCKVVACSFQSKTIYQTDIKEITHNGNKYRKCKSRLQGG